MSELDIRIDHVSFVIADVGASLDFYVDVVGLKKDDSRPNLNFPGVWLKAGSQGVHLLQVDNPDPVSGRPDHGGRDRHVAFHIEDLNALISRLEASHLVYTHSRSGREAIFFRDPDGNGLEFIQSTPAR